MRIGVDSYSYHRLLGEVRAGEEDPRARFPNGGSAVVEEALTLAVEGVSLETCFLGPPSRLDADALRETAGPLEIALSWGAPNGLELGSAPAQLAALLDWIDVAARLGCRTVRIVAAGPALHARVTAELSNVIAPLRDAAEQAGSLGLQLALENHGDLTAVQIAELLEQVADDALGVCFDTANALRVGDDPVEAARLLASAVRIVHLKDCEPLEAAADPIAGPRSVPYGTGVIPLDEILDLLEETGFYGLLCVEVAQLGPGVDERALVGECVAWLRARERTRTAA